MKIYFLITIIILSEILMGIIIFQIWKKVFYSKNVVKVKYPFARIQLKQSIKEENEANTHTDTTEDCIQNGIHIENLKANFRAPYNGNLLLELEHGEIIINDTIQYELTGILKNIYVKKGDIIRIISDKPPKRAIFFEKVIPEKVYPKLSAR